MRRLIVVALVLFSLAGGTALAQQFSTLEERMTQAEFKAAGLEKLTPEELAALNTWLAGKSTVAATAPAQDTRGFNTSSGDDTTVVSSIPGTFRGWRSKGDRFLLANGQIWEVSDSSSRMSVKLENPKVTIESGLFGAWFLRVEGYNTRARVERIK